ncbi:uncharacterized protein FOMMEDRAFT_150832 [Fomitiporia mediterranea MF3/22]|uniref:uncharacterized protein n=1 Tax=Fomitiporia mediterranea (strain MF3/22) TaxID=694068 RepID=UPI000440804D|nr:uncharacterized protein FOMMEDRAFT_150832 [Fomitiporia mediterranea MF3/22]EJD08139.1 hypothetical protein FOMMEDRAFT_150832 [Fomitiporia mediterranea MF3/22]
MVENVAYNSDNRKGSRDRLHYEKRNANDEVVLSQVTDEVANYPDHTEERFVEVAFRTLAPGLPIIPTQEVIEGLELRDAQKLANAYNLPPKLSWPLLKRELNDTRNGILSAYTKEVLSKNKTAQARKASVSEDAVRESKRQRTSKETVDGAPSVTVSFSLSRRRPSVGSCEDEEEYHIMKLAHQLLCSSDAAEDTESFDEDKVRRNILDGDCSMNAEGEGFTVERKKSPTKVTQSKKALFVMYLKRVAHTEDSISRSQRAQTLADIPNPLVKAGKSSRSAGPMDPDDNFFGPRTLKNTSLQAAQAALVSIPYQMVSPGREPDSPTYAPDSPACKLAGPVYSPDSPPFEQPIETHKADSTTCVPESQVDAPTRSQLQLYPVPSSRHGKQRESGMKQDAEDSGANDYKGSHHRSHSGNRNKGSHKKTYTYVLRAPDWSQSNQPSPDEEYDYKEEEMEFQLGVTRSEEPPDSEYDYEEEEVEFLLDPTLNVEDEGSFDDGGDEECDDHTHSPGCTDGSSFSRSMRRLTKMGDEARAKKREALEAEEESDLMAEHDSNYNFEQAFRSSPARQSPCCYNYKGTTYILPKTDKQNRTVRNHCQSGRPECNDVERPSTEASPLRERRGDGERYEIQRSPVFKPRAFVRPSELET